MNTRSYSPGRFPAAPECGDIIKEDKLSESKYTPGPWIARCNHVYTKAGDSVAHECDTADTARLIAAAPVEHTCLKECVEVLEFIEDDLYSSPRIRRAIKKGRAALAKAEGK